MTTHEMIIVWLASLAACLGLSIGPILLSDHLIALRRSQIYVIGSSLMNYAVPAEGHGPTSLLGDGRSHIRFGRPMVSEPVLLTQLDQAIDHRAKIVFLEADPFLFDFASHTHQRACDGWKFAAASYLIDGPSRVLNAFRDLRGLLFTHTFSVDPDDIAAAHAGYMVKVRADYPLAFRPPCDSSRLAAAVARARSQGTRVILILPPRSPDAERMLGSAQLSELNNRARDLATRLGLSLYVSHDQWPNSEFVDTAHLNLSGRAHFHRDLDRWWASAR